MTFLIRWRELSSVKLFFSFTYLFFFFFSSFFFLFSFVLESFYSVKKPHLGISRSLSIKLQEREDQYKCVPNNGIKSKHFTLLKHSLPSKALK